MFKIKQENFDFFKTVYKDMTEQFPATELKSFKRFKQLLRLDKYCLYSVSDKGRQVGYFILLKDNIKRVLWLDYIAILKEHQSKGYGHKIFDQLKQYFASDFNVIYLEVEMPDICLKNTLRRISFYKNLGAKKLDIKYFYPNPGGELEMDLYFLPFKNTVVPEKAEIQQTVNLVFNTIHTDCCELNSILSKIS